MPPPHGREHSCAYAVRVDWTPEEIRRRRDTQGLSQEDLAKALGVSRRAVTNWETGAAVPGGKNLRGLDRVLGDPPRADDPTLSQADFLELLAEIARRYARAANNDDPHSAPDLPRGRYSLRSEDTPTARRARDQRHSDETIGEQVL